MWSSHMEMKSSFDSQTWDCSRPRLFSYLVVFSVQGDFPVKSFRQCLQPFTCSRNSCLLPLPHFNLMQILWWCVTGGPQLTLCCAHCTGGIPQWHSCKCNHESQFMVTTLCFNFPWELWPDSGLEPVRKLENCFQVLSVKIKNTCWALRRKKAISLGG